MTARKPLPEGLDPAGFAVRDAIRAGASRQRLQRSDLTTPFRGSRARDLPDTPLDRCRALAPVLASGMAFSGSTAAHIWDLPVPRLPRGFPLRVSSLRPGHAIRRPGTIGSQRGYGEPVSHDRLPVLGPEQTWVSLGREISQYDLTAVADRLISGTLRMPALTTRTHLLEHLELSRGVPGVPRLRRALDDARECVWSRPETLLRLLVGFAGLPEPIPNHEVHDHTGVMIIDLAWPQWQFAMEYDGRWHDRDPATAAHDATRRERMLDLGWTSMHVRADDLFGAPHAVIARVFHRLSTIGYPRPRAVDLTQIPRFTR
jgi:hypothetical protein